MVEFRRRVEGCPMTHFLSQLWWRMYNGTGIQICQRQLKGCAGRQNQLKIIIGDFSSVFRSHQEIKCQVWKNTVLFALETRYCLFTNLPQINSLWTQQRNPELFLICWQRQTDNDVFYKKKSLLGASSHTCSRRINDTIPYCAYAAACISFTCFAFATVRYQQLSKRTNTNRQLGQFWWYEYFSKHKHCVIKTKKYYNYYSLFYRLVTACGDLWVFVLVELTYQHKTWCSPFWVPCRLRTPNRT